MNECPMVMKCLDGFPTCKNCKEKSEAKFCSFTCFLKYREKYPEDMDL